MTAPRFFAFAFVVFCCVAAVPVPLVAHWLMATYPLTCAEVPTCFSAALALVGMMFLSVMFLDATAPPKDQC